MKSFVTAVALLAASAFSAEAVGGLADGRYCVVFLGKPPKATMTGALLICGHSYQVKDQVAAATPAAGDFKIGDRVETEYAGPWYPGRVTKVERGGYVVHYDDPKWNDVCVEAKRVRVKR